MNLRWQHLHQKLFCFLFLFLQLMSPLIYQFLQLLSIVLQLLHHTLHHVRFFTMRHILQFTVDRAEQTRVLSDIMFLATLTTGFLQTTCTQCALIVLLFYNSKTLIFGSFDLIEYPVELLPCSFALSNYSW